jgi:hypothetical protein
MSKLITGLVAVGLTFGLNAAIAQNTDSASNQSQAQSSSGTATGQYNTAGERQLGLEQYRSETQQCQSMAAEARSDCMHLAKVRYQGWAIMQCDLVSGPSRQRCYQNIQSNVGGASTGSTGTAVRSSTGASDTNATPETGQAVRRGEDEDKPPRQ